MSKSIDLKSDCPMNLTINILSGKWKLSILWYFSRGTIRFNELQRTLANITQKTLTMQLNYHPLKAGGLYLLLKQLKIIFP